MEQMYKGIPFSPTATLTANIGAADTIIQVSDVDAFPDAPNIATIGSIAGPNETIIYTGKTTTSLTGCTRGVEGTASDWAVDELIGRNFTAKDHADMVKNIEELESNKLDASYKVDVVNTTDVSAGGKALDARQNNPSITGTLAQKVANNTQQINVLSANTFMKPTCQQHYKGVFIKDWDNVIENGLYMSNLAAHAPMGEDSEWWIVEVKAHNDLYCVQDAYGFTDLKCKRFTRTLYNGIWSEWIPINEIHSVITFFNGWSQFGGHQRCQVGRIGNRCFLSGLATKGAVADGINVLQVPEYFYPKTAPGVLVNGEYGFYIGTNGVLTLKWIRDATIDSSHSWYSLDGLSWEVE